jgi:CheY-like chemotaxis protein
MARILLLDSEPLRARELTQHLERRQHIVVVCATKRQLFETLKRHHKDFDIILLDLTADRSEDWTMLDQIHCIVCMDTSAPMILCVAEVYRGPDMKLKAERKGARFVYEQ